MLAGEGGDPLIRIDVIEGRSEAEIKALLDAAHRAVVAAFKVPERYQILGASALAYDHRGHWARLGVLTKSWWCRW